MTNAEKYLKDAQALLELPSKLRDYIDKQQLGYVTATMITDFFVAEAKPTITEDERVILRNLDKRYKLICKDNVCNLFVKNGTYDIEKINPLNKLFQFIKERRRILY